MKDPILTKEYWTEKAESSCSLSSNNFPFIADTFPLNKPVPIDTSAIITHTNAGDPWRADCHPNTYPAPISTAPKTTHNLGLTHLSAIHPPIIGVKYVNATKFAPILAPSAASNPNPPFATAATINTPINHLDE